MSDNKNTNAAGSDDWDSFLAEHENDLGSLEESRAAKKFEKQAEKAERNALLDANDLKAHAFTMQSRIQAQQRMQAEEAPRGYRSSWLDADKVLDDASPFVPPDPDVSDIRKSSILFGILFVLGIAGVVVSAFLPGVIAFVAPVAGVLLIIGAAGLFTRLRGHSRTKSNPFDDGARV
jgi:hypothetical protein